MDKPSKNMRKREQHALQQLGEQLIPLKDQELDAMGLSDDLLAAVRAASKIKAHGALRRQKQLIGKLMRQADADLIRARLGTVGAREQQEKRLFAEAESWRDRLLSERPTARAEFASLTGADDAELARLLDELATTLDERREKSLKRQVFRRVHDILVRISQ